jgi:phosphate transport system substrate-binding protein
VSAVDIHLSEDRKGVHMSFKLIRTAAAVALTVASFGVLARRDRCGRHVPGADLCQVGRRLQQGHRRAINYQSVGSGAGIKQIKAKTVDFGASDMPLKDDDLAKDGWCSSRP